MKSKVINGNVHFYNFVVVKESDNFFAVYKKFSKFGIGYTKALITSGTTLNNACKKAKLLQQGYDLCEEDLN